MTQPVRRWQVVRLYPGERVVLRNFAVLDPGQVLEDDPAPQVEVNWPQWLVDHDTVYGLTLDGTATADAATLQQAINRLKATANASPVRAMDSNDAKAVLRILREIRSALAE